MTTHGYALGNNNDDWHHVKVKCGLDPQPSWGFITSRHNVQFSVSSGTDVHGFTLEVNPNDIRYPHDSGCEGSYDKANT